MGLDMYLTGRKTSRPNYEITREEREALERKEDGFIVDEVRLDLGYWRKHPNLHGYIVRTFAAGNDNCQEIWLSEENLEQILQAVKADDLPHTEGFFFGRSGVPGDEYYDEEKQRTIQVLEKAIAWFNDKSDENVWKDVIYQASW